MLCSLSLHFSQCWPGAWFRCLYVGIWAYETSPWSGQIQALRLIWDLQKTQSLLNWSSGGQVGCQGDSSKGSEQFTCEHNIINEFQRVTQLTPQQKPTDLEKGQRVGLLSLRLCFCMWLYAMWFMDLHHSYWCRWTSIWGWWVQWGGGGGARKLVGSLSARGHQDKSL